MSDAIKQSMLEHQNDYRRIIALLGHSRAQRLGFQKDEEDYEKELLVVIKKIRNLESQMPKEGEKPNAESSHSDNDGNTNNEPKQNSN